MTKLLSGSESEFFARYYADFTENRDHSFCSYFNSFTVVEVPMLDGFSRSATLLAWPLALGNVAVAKSALVSHMSQGQQAADKNQVDCESGSSNRLEADSLKNPPLFHLQMNL